MGAKQSMLMKINLHASSPCSMGISAVSIIAILAPPCTHTHTHTQPLSPQAATHNGLRPTEPCCQKQHWNNSPFPTAQLTTDTGLIWLWSGSNLALIWPWSGPDLALIRLWSGSNLLNNINNSNSNNNNRTRSCVGVLVEPGHVWGF